MSDDALDELREQLRSDPPHGLRALAEEDLRHLAQAIHAARARQAAALEHAAEHGFSYVPRLLRGPIRRILR
ncbi:MAG TPA: hypothetical protein VFP55_04855 [Solirubrobacteraceae bacterium]|nr:hypothetical protein [Solirubrobacteraceae bacterium]